LPRHGADAAPRRAGLRRARRGGQDPRQRVPRHHAAARTGPPRGGGLLVCGVSTHSCVAQTALDALDDNIRAAGAVDAVYSDDAELSRVLLEFLREQTRQPLLGLDESLDLLRTGHWPA